MANSQNLEDMKLPELKELAKQMGLRGTSTMRKPELLATLQAARNGGEPPAGVTVRAPKAAKTAKVVKAPQSDAAEANTTDNADVATQSPAPAPAATEPQLDLPLPVADDAKKDETNRDAPVVRPPMMPHPNRVRPAVVAMTTSPISLAASRARRPMRPAICWPRSIWEMQRLPSVAASVTRTWKFR